MAYALPMQFNAPLSCQRADQLVGLLALSQSDAVLEVGCGQGALLRKVVARWGCQALGIDIDGAAIDTALQAADAQGLAITFRCADAKLLYIKADGGRDWGRVTATLGLSALVEDESFATPAGRTSASGRAAPSTAPAPPMSNFIFSSIEPAPALML